MEICRFVPIDGGRQIWSDAGLADEAAI